jgi:hypothetical protein
MNLSGTWTFSGMDTIHCALSPPTLEVAVVIQQSGPPPASLTGTVAGMPASGTIDTALAWYLGEDSVFVVSGSGYISPVPGRFFTHFQSGAVGCEANYIGSLVRATQ